MTGCEFILTNIMEDEVKHENGYDIFEPTISLQIDGRNVFRSLGLDGVNNVVVMVFRERGIQVTLGMIRDITSDSEQTYRIWLTGTGFGFRLNRVGDILRIFIEVDGHYGPVQGISWPQLQYVEDVSVEEWVRAFLLFSQSLSRVFQDLNPRVYGLSTISEQEEKISEIASWLKRKPSVRMTG